MTVSPNVPFCGFQVADHGAALAVGHAVDPRFVDPAAFDVRVALEVFDLDEIGRGEAPDVAHPRALGIGRIDLIHTPVVGLVPCECACVEGDAGLAALEQRTGRIGGSHGGRVIAEVDLVLLCLLAGTPAQHRRLRGIDRSIRRARVESLQRRQSEGIDVLGADDRLRRDAAALPGDCDAVAAAAFLAEGLDVVLLAGLQGDGSGLLTGFLLPFARSRSRKRRVRSRRRWPDRHPCSATVPGRRRRRSRTCTRPSPAA